MHEEQQRAIAHTRQPRPKAAAIALLFVFLADFLFDLLPLDAEGGIGEHVVELLAGQPIVRQRVAEDDVGDVLPLDQHVGLADGVGLRVQLLAIHDEPSIRVQPGQMLAADGQHAAGACRRIVQRPHHAGLGQGVVVFDEEQVDHEPNDFARREVLACRFVRQFSELAD